MYDITYVFYTTRIPSHEYHIYLETKLSDPFEIDAPNIDPLYRDNNIIDLD